MRHFNAQIIAAHTLYWSINSDTEPNKMIIKLKKSNRYHILVARSYPHRLPAVYVQLYRAINTVLGCDLKSIALQDIKENDTFGFFIQWINGWNSTIYNVREVANSFDFPIKSRFKEDIITAGVRATRYMYAIDCRVIDFIRLMNRVPEQNTNVLFWE